MKIIYRVNRITENYERQIIAQDVMLVDTKEDFKTAMRLTLGDNIKFRSSENMNAGDIYISIISYDCYNAEDYVSVQDYICSNCNRSFKANKHNLLGFTDRYYLKSICEPFFNAREQELNSYTYCSLTCKQEHSKKLIQEFTDYGREHDIITNEFVTRYATIDTSANDTGYIYMITKKSTGEFYVGQTNTIPMFRWVQHLKTDRFPVQCLTDYKFEVLEQVDHCTIYINDREAYWINKMYNENPNLCLNKIIPPLPKKE